MKIVTVLVLALYSVCLVSRASFVPVPDVGNNDEHECKQINRRAMSNFPSRTLENYAPVQEPERGMMGVARGPLNQLLDLIRTKANVSYYTSRLVSGILGLIILCVGFASSSEYDIGRVGWSLELLTILDWVILILYLNAQKPLDADFPDFEIKQVWLPYVDAFSFIGKMWAVDFVFERSFLAFLFFNSVQMLINGTNLYEQYQQ